jgi:hypothetical protein
VLVEEAQGSLNEYIPSFFVYDSTDQEQRRRKSVDWPATGADKRVVDGGKDVLIH